MTDTTADLPVGTVVAERQVQMSPLPKQSHDMRSSQIVQRYMSTMYSSERVSRGVFFRARRT